MKHLVNKVLIVCLVIWPLSTVAQNISVSSFKLLENDLTANTTGTMERDQNGEVAALIKVVTTEQGFVFDGGMSGIVKTKQGVGEVWVYVPHGIKKITIQHPQLGVLRDYYFPISVEKAKTYEMVLTTGKVETVVTHAINKQFVIFNVKPANAVVELNEEVLAVDGEGYAEKGLPFGTYNYRVSCTNYHTEAGQVTVTAQGKAEVKVTLRPNFGWIKIDGASEYHGAYVYVDNERIGQLPLTSKEVKSGEHRVKVVKSMYKTYEQQVTVVDNETTNLNVAMTPNFANITLSTDAESEIWVDGKLKGKGEWTGPMEIGEYNVEVKRTSHRTQSKIVHIATLSERTIPLPSPTPVYGGLEITSKPTRATVYIDDVAMGETPLVLSNVLVGSRELKLVKEGYEEHTETVPVAENSSNQRSVTLDETPKEVMVSITSKPRKAEIKIDGTVVGTTPLKLPVAVGHHNFRASKKGYWDRIQNKDIDSASDKIHFKMYKHKKENANDFSFLFGGGIGYCAYGLNWGLELDMTLKRFSLGIGTSTYNIGTIDLYDATDYHGSFYGETQEVLVEVGSRVTARIGYAFPITRYFSLIPQIGLNFKTNSTADSFDELLAETEEDNYGYYLNINLDYSELKKNYTRYVQSPKCLPTLGVRMELKTLPDNDHEFEVLGLHVTPEYSIHDGFAITAGFCWGIRYMQK